MKIVSRRSTAPNRYGDKENVCGAVCAMSIPFARSADSNTRTTVVPTAAIRLASLILRRPKGK